MLDKATHAKVEKIWAKLGPGVYQRWNRLETRMPLFLKYIDKFKGKNVIEFGCNAGIYGYEIAKVAQSYIGVDQGDYYIAQAQATKKFFDMNNATFKCKRVKAFIRDCQKAEERGEDTPKINAVFATFVLYHLNDKETDLIAEYLFPKCGTVVIMTRTSKRSPWRKYNGRKLHEIKNVEKYLEENGYQCESEMHVSKKFGITIATKEIVDDNDNGKGEGDRQGTNKSTRRPRSPRVSKRRVREGGEVLPAEREVDAERSNGVLPQAQAGVGTEGDVQGGQREMLSSEQTGGDEGVEEQEET